MTHTCIDTPVGRLTVMASEHGIRRILWAGEAPPPECVPGESLLLTEATRQIGEYFKGSRTTFDLPLDLVGTPFQRQAWAALGTIPFGETISYAEQARRIGNPRATRAVGAANGRNPVPVVLPCHRVIGADGRLTGFGGGLDVKLQLLQHETRIQGSAPADANVPSR